MLVAACTDDPIVYPNRNLRAANAGSAGDAGAAGDVPSAGTETGGMPQGGGGNTTDSAGAAGEEAAGAAGAPMVGPVCGNGVLEPPEQCDDGNTVSGDGCSADCVSSCEKCEQKVCPVFADATPPQTSSAYDDCYKTTGIIGTGPAGNQNVSRAEVCSELVDCIREQQCAQVRAGSFYPQRCWCDKDWDPKTRMGSPFTACSKETDPQDLDGTFTPGKCASLFQDASESGKLQDVVAKLTAAETAEGAALRLLGNCDARNCTEECVAGYFKAGAIATITADILSKPNPAGESALGDLIADSQRAAAGTDFAFVDPEFIAADTPDLLLAPTPNRDADAKGRVLWSEALAVSFGHSATTAGASLNTNLSYVLYQATFSGEQIYTALTQQFMTTSPLFVSGLNYTYDAALPIESRVIEVRKGGTPIDRTANYTVALTQRLAVSSSSPSPIRILAQGANAAIVPNVSPPETLGEYLMQLPQPVAPPELNRITRVN